MVRNLLIMAIAVGMTKVNGDAIEDCCFSTCKYDARCCTDERLAFWRGDLTCSRCNGDGCGWFRCSAFTTWNCPNNNAG